MQPAKDKPLKGYKCRWRDDDCKWTADGYYPWEYFNATSPSAARYAYFVEVNTRGELSLSYSEVLNAIEVLRNKESRRESIDPSRIKDFLRVIKNRGIDFAEIGMQVDCDGKKGRIVGANMSAGLDVLFDGQKHKSNCHPRWRMKYFSKDGELLKAYGD